MPREQQLVRGNNCCAAKVPFSPLDCEKCVSSPSGNRTPVSRVTGGDTYHYTNEDWQEAAVKFLNLDLLTCVAPRNK